MRQVGRRSPLAEAAGSIDYLLHYPYGCVEQTTSSLIPWCAVEDLKGVIPAFAKMPQEKVKAAIQAGSLDAAPVASAFTEGVYATRDPARNPGGAGRATSSRHPRIG